MFDLKYVFYTGRNAKKQRLTEECMWRNSTNLVFFCDKVVKMRLFVFESTYILLATEFGSAVNFVLTTYETNVLDVWNGPINTDYKHCMQIGQLIRRWRQHGIVQNSSYLRCERKGLYYWTTLLVTLFMTVKNNVFDIKLIVDDKHGVWNLKIRFYFRY